MQIRLIATSAFIGLGFVAPAQAADMAAGKAIATTVCAACHGANGISVSPRVPNLAGQRAAYMEKQLGAYKGKKRKHTIMNALAAQLSKAQIGDVAAFYGSLPGAAVGAPNSKPPSNYIAKRATLPRGFAGYTHYKTFNHTRRKQLRKVYANATAVAAAKAGRPLPDGSIIVVEAFKAKLGSDGKPVVGSDGMFVATGRAGFTSMERQAGWGNDFPALIRNENWHYSVFKPDGSPRPNINQASCLSCHLPHAANSYLFTLKELTAAARK